MSFQSRAMAWETIEFFQVPEPVQRGRARNFSKYQRFYRGGGSRNLLNDKSSIEKKSSEFFQVAELRVFPSPRASIERGGGAQIFFKCQSLYRGGEISELFSSYFFIFPSYFFIFSTYFFLISSQFLHISSFFFIFTTCFFIFLHTFFIFLGLEKFQASSFFEHSPLAKHRAKRGVTCLTVSSIYNIGSAIWKKSKLSPIQVLALGKITNFSLYIGSGTPENSYLSSHI